jgi:hypothetical protein
MHQGLAAIRDRLFDRRLQKSERLLRAAVLSVVRICRLRGRSELSSAVILTAVGFVYTSVARLGARAEPARSIIKFNPTRDSV